MRIQDVTANQTHITYFEKKPSEGAFLPGRDFNTFAISNLFLEILELIKNATISELPPLNIIL